jgi:hypothetical protein
MIGRGHRELQTMAIWRDGLDSQRVLLAGFLHDLHADLAGSEMELMLAANADEFAAAVRRTAGKLAEAERRLGAHIQHGARHR